MAKKTAWCSCCLAKTTHIPHATPWFGRDRYRCAACDEETVECRVCENMARPGDQFCAEHNGLVPSFEALALQLDELTDYPRLFERKAVNFRRAGRIAGIALTAMTITTPIALAARAATLGTVAASVGAAVGRTAAIAAGGIALNGAVGGLVANQYYSDIKGFGIDQLQDGLPGGVIAMDGFLTAEKADVDTWRVQLAQLFPHQDWYYLRWESKRLEDLGHTLGRSVVNASLLMTLERWALGAARLAGIGTGLTVAATVGWLAGNPWSVALHKAEETGKLLAFILARTRGAPVTLVGHSLGARVIYFTLEALAENDCRDRVREVHLLGGAVTNESDAWAKCCQAVTERIFNYHSDADWVLRALYPVGVFFTNKPIGITPISGCSRIVNVDVTATVGDHFTYKNNFAHARRGGPP